MKHFTHNSMAILAFAALLATPPAVLKHSHISRSIASEPSIKPLEAEDLKPLPKIELPELKKLEVSVEPEVKLLEAKDLEIPKVKLPELKHGDINVAHPRYDKLVQKVSDSKSNEDLELSLKVFKEKRDKLKEEIAKLKDDKSDKKSEKIEDLAISLLLVEGSLKDLKEKKVISPKESEESRLVIYDAKNELEFILMDLEKPASEKVAKSEEKSEKKSESKEVAKKEESKDEAKKDKAEVACAAEEKVSVLSKQIQQLMEDQNKVMQNMLSMSQMMMMNMMMQQQKQMQQPQQSVPYQYPNQAAYQYQQPQTSGSWVYYPQGYQPYQNNIFSSPQLTQYQGGFYPDQVHQQQPSQSSWGLQPTMNFNTSSMVTPGTFGGSGTSFNMSNSVPTISQR